MSVNLSLLGGAAAQFFDNNGNPLTGGKVYTYAAGTTTPQATYTTSAGNVAHTNPIVLDAAGRVSAGGEIWLSDAVSYKFAIYTSADVLIGTYDNITGNASGILADLANTTNPAKGDALVGFRQSNSSGNLTGAVGRTVHAKLQEIVSVLDFGADPTGVADSTTQIQAALDALPNGGTVYVPAGTYKVKSVTINYSYIALIGDENNAAKFVSPAGRWGHTILCNDKEFVSVKNITFDNDLAQIEGALWFGGARDCIIENCKFLNGDFTSMSISGAGGASGGTRIAYDNIVKDCYAEGQKNYHPTGTSPFIAGNNAQRTTFLNCVVSDCAADAFDADNAPYTRFVNCTATESGSRAPFAAFWSECTEVNVDGYEVIWENCYAQNYGVGFGTSERVQGTMINPMASNCTKAIWHHSDDAVLTVLGGRFDYCGENSATSAAVLLEFTATVSDVVFKNTQYTNAILVYSGGGPFIDDSIQISKCSVDKPISIGYGNNGCMNIRVEGCLFNGANLTYFDCANKTLLVDGNIFVSGGIAGARIGRSIVTNNIFRDNNALPTLTAIDLSIDNFNTYFNDNVFIYYLNVTNNGTPGKNTYTLCTNFPNAKDYVTKKQVTIVTGGTDYPIVSAARGSFLLLVSGNDPDNATGAYLIQGTSFTLDHTVTVLADKADYGTANKFTVTFPSGGPIQITHPTSGRVANCTLVSYDF